MKNVILLFSLFISTASFQCKKDYDKNLGVYKAVLKFDGGCTGKYGCVIMQGTISSGLVDNNWNWQGETYAKAFTVANPCDFKGIKLNQEFSFIIVPAYPNSLCAFCDMAISGYPQKSLFIEVIK
jgi:hypothetical protein